MMAKISAWMPVYIGDYLGDTTRLSTEQHGAYLLLLFDYWRNGAPPLDDAVLCQITKLKMAQWQRHKPALLAMFQVEEGRLVHPRVDAERVKASSHQERRSNKASKAARARWDGANDDAPVACSKHPPSNAPECPPPSPSFTNVKGADAPVDLAKKVFDEGLALLTGAGDKQPAARSFLAKLRKDHGDAKVAAAIGEAARRNVSEPRAWLMASLTHQVDSQSELLASIRRTFGDKEKTA